MPAAAPKKRSAALRAAVEAALRAAAVLPASPPEPTSPQVEMWGGTCSYDLFGGAREAHRLLPVRL